MKLFIFELKMGDNF